MTIVVKVSIALAPWRQISKFVYCQAKGARFKTLSFVVGQQMVTMV